MRKLTKKQRKKLYLKIAQINESNKLPETYRSRISVYYFGFCVAASEELYETPDMWDTITKEIFPEYFIMRPEKTIDGYWFGTTPAGRRARATCLCFAAEMCN